MISVSLIVLPTIRPPDCQPWRARSSSRIRLFSWQAETRALSRQSGPLHRFQGGDNGHHLHAVRCRVRVVPRQASELLAVDDEDRSVAAGPARILQARAVGVDVDALLEGISDGTLSILASDHAPHADFEKEVEFDAAPFGIIGLESELGLFLDLLVHKRRKIDIMRLIEMYTVEPRRLLKINAGTLSIGAAADVTLIDPDLEWTVRVDKFESASRNSPFDGWKLKGRAVRTIVGGKTVWEL